MLSFDFCFFNFCLFFCLYSTLTTVRIDWWKGIETLHWLNEAHAEVGL